MLVFSITLIVATPFVAHRRKISTAHPNRLSFWPSSCEALDTRDGIRAEADGCRLFLSTLIALPAFLTIPAEVVTGGWANNELALEYKASHLGLFGRRSVRVGCRRLAFRVERD